MAGLPFRALPVRSWFARAGASLGRALLRWSEWVEPKPKIEVLPELRARFPGAPESWLQAIAERLQALGELGIEMPLQAVAPPVTRPRPVPRLEPAAVEAPQKEKASGAHWPAPAEPTVARIVEFASVAERAGRPAALINSAHKPSVRPILFRLPQRAKPASATPSAEPSPRSSRRAVFLGVAKAKRPEAPIFSAASKAVLAALRFRESGAAMEKPEPSPSVGRDAPPRHAVEPAWAPVSAAYRQFPEFSLVGDPATAAAVSVGDQVPAGPKRKEREDRSVAPAPQWPSLPEQHLRPQNSSATIRLIEYRARLDRLKHEQSERLWNG